MKKDWDYIEDKISEIMINDGPDGHSNGSGIIADFVMALMNGKEEEWWISYEKYREIEDEKRRKWREERWIKNKSS